MGDPGRGDHRRAGSNDRAAGTAARIADTRAADPARGDRRPADDLIPVAEQDDVRLSRAAGSPRGRPVRRAACAAGCRDRSIHRMDAMQVQ